jgi:adenylyltransferase/sulfurtransferase
VDRGYIPGARWISRGFLEQRIEDQVPEALGGDRSLYCAGGTRSALAARSLAELGYTNVKSMAGRSARGSATGLKFDRPFVMTRSRAALLAPHDAARGR